MLIELGHLALWLAAGAALLTVLRPGLARPASLAQGGLTLAALVALLHAFATSDFSVALVTAHSHSDKPDLYKLTGLWANHEGSMLLWVAILVIAGAMLAWARSPLGPAFQNRALQVQAAISLGFFAFLLGVSNPFERLSPAPTQGNGLNPILQDPGLAFHPPTLYIGYVGLSVAFALAVAAMWEDRLGPVWARAVRPWVLGAWAALTAGIALGSFWAYYELGWGGFWFWDPVENASLMPWLAATALLHSVSVLARRDALRNWTVLLAVAAFSFSMIGTFLVRSGVLTSVHSFAVDPERGVLLLILLGLYIGGALTLYAMKAGQVRAGAVFSPLSRESGLVLNNLGLSAILGVVLIGTLYPLALEALGEETISVGPPYFDQTVTPIAFVLFAALGLGPLLPWRKAPLPLIIRRAVGPAVGLAAVAVLTLMLAPNPTPLAVFGFALCAWIAAGSVLPLIRSARPAPALAGMALAHLGVAVFLFGTVAAGTQGRDLLVVLPEGGATRMGELAMRLAEVTPAAGPNYTAVRAELVLSRDGAEIARLYPETRTYSAPSMETTEAGIASGWRGDLYATLGKPSLQGWQVKLADKPLVGWIWAGGLLIGLGGLVSLLPRVRRSVATRFTHERAFRPGIAQPVPAE